MSYFLSEELEYFQQWANLAYNPADKLHIDAKNRLMATVWEKSLNLVKGINSELQNFQIKGGKYWSQRGWANVDLNKKKQAAIIKPYTWYKICRKADDGKDIFFTFGIDARPQTLAFVYKIDLRRTRDSRLSKEQIENADQLIPNSANWCTIPFDELTSFDYDSLVSTCSNFVINNLVHYDAVIEMLKSNAPMTRLKKGILNLKSRPKRFSYAKRKSRNVHGNDIDYIEQNIFLKRIGDLGENLVIDLERKYLIKHNQIEQAALVTKVRDVEGFDILSYDLEGNKRYIEVKTTIGPANKPFFLSDNEFRFMKANITNYYIYRIYNFNEKLNSGDFFVLNNNIEEQIITEPIVFRITIK